MIILGRLQSRHFACAWQLMIQDYHCLMMILTLDTSFNIRVTLRSYAYVLAVQHVVSLAILDLSKKKLLGGPLYRRQSIYCAS